MASLRWLAAPLLVLMIAAEAHADAGPGCLFPFVRRDPRPWERGQLPSKEHELVIVRDPNAKVAELRIPRAMMVADASPQVSTRHALAGLALSASFVGGGLWCLRYRGGQIPRKKVLIAVVVGFVLLSLLTTIDFAGATPPRKPPLPQVIRLDEVAVDVVFVEQGAEVELVVPPELADKIAGIAPVTPIDVPIHNSTFSVDTPKFGGYQPRLKLIMTRDKQATTAQLVLSKNVVALIRPAAIPPREVIERGTIRIRHDASTENIQLILAKKNESK